MDIDRLLADGKAVTSAAVRAYLVWVGLAVALGVEDTDTAGVLATVVGCCLLLLAYLVSLALLLWREFGS